MEPIKAWLVDSPLRFLLTAALLAVLVFIPYDILVLTVQDRKALWIEGHSLLFDLLVFGVVLTAYETIRRRREERAQRQRERARRIEHFEYALDDYRDWNERPATLRIIGTVKRLNREGCTAIDLSYCHLTHGRLLEVQLRGANLRRTNFRQAELWRADLREAKAVEANFERAVLWGADLRGADLWRANLKGADLRDADLRGAHLTGAHLEGAKVSGQDWLDQLSNRCVEGAADIVARYELDEEAIAFNTYHLRRRPVSASTNALVAEMG